MTCRRKRGRGKREDVEGEIVGRSWGWENRGGRREEGKRRGREEGEVSGRGILRRAGSRGECGV
jgi:hypothetical protein